ncbi:hypothetical protein [uncultured Sphingomonas sp.]|uniref:hypothetical protein n=1 Tax=uncultured Sphingomonas sp. TaxID=158754 RepID=UPI0035C976E3
MRSLFLAILSCALASPVAAQQVDGPLPEAARLTDAQLARLTGKFLLPNGVELALSVTSDTVVNGQLVLRTVLTVDRGSQVQVYGRESGASGIAYTGASGGAQATAPTGVSITLDRQSGLQTVTPTYAAATPSVSVGAAVQTPESLGLSALPVVAGGASVVTADGTVSVAAVPSGTQVTLVGDQFSVANLVGRAVATALVNSANDRTFDTVTNVGIDLRNIAPYQAGAAQMHIETLALDAARGMVR